MKLLSLFPVMLGLVLITALSALAATPPVTCKKAITPVERTICSAPELMAMDREMAALYDRGLAELSGDRRHSLAESQLSFLKARSGCAWAAHHSAHPGSAVNECIHNKMEERLHALRFFIEHDNVGGR